MEALAAGGPPYDLLHGADIRYWQAAHSLQAFFHFFANAHGFTARADDPFQGRYRYVQGLDGVRRLTVQDVHLRLWILVERAVPLVGDYADDLSRGLVR